MGSRHLCPETLDSSISLVNNTRETSPDSYSGCIILSSATFPSEYEIKDCIEDFKNKFDNPSVHTISSNDYKKTIPILGKDNKVKLPHNICSSYEELQKSIDHCCDNLTILRYFDIKSIVEFAKHLKSKNYINISGVTYYSISKKDELRI